MGLLTYRKIEKDFPGGLYLPLLDQPVPLKIINPGILSSLLALPLRIGDGSIMRPVVAQDEIVKAGQLLAQSGDGYYIYSPCDAQVKSQSEAFVEYRPGQPVLQLQCISEEIQGCTCPEFSLERFSQKQNEMMLNVVDRSGIVNPTDGQPLSRLLRKLKNQNVTHVIANATGLEPDLVASLVVLDKFPEQVFTAQAILRQWLNASEAIMAYPYHFEIDRNAAETWNVKCVPVSEKYPQGRDALILKTLHNSGNINNKIGIGAVFDIQMLRQLERLILAGQLPYDRIVTVCGDGVKKPGHYQVPVGTGVKDLINYAQVEKNISCVAAQSTLAGYAIDPETAVITTRSQAIIVLADKPVRQVGTCIRCGRCIENCPVGIDPMRIHSLAENEKYDQAVKIGVAKCIECGTCSYVCPASLPLDERIRLVKCKKNIQSSRCCQ
ncbi:MAG: 4Fe-4S dicluster domain-containing protein [Phycisphaerae bacterium]|nr:4Fe-4S dicluster domain-containing protein [Phycisphaerae bacterium]